MANAESPGPRPAGIPRWLALVLAPVVWLVAVPAAHAGIPWALSRLGPRYGWADGEWAGWNLLGYVPVAVWAVLLVWVMVFGFSQFRRLPEQVPVDWSPALLMTGGPYAISRHPMYIGELALWLGWAILYGSVPVPRRQVSLVGGSRSERWLCGSDEFRQRLGIILGQVLRSAGKVCQRRLMGIDPQVVVEGGEQLAPGDRPGDRLARDLVGCPDHLPGPHPAAGQQRAIHLRPVVPADLGADLRCPSELAHNHHGAIVVQPPLVKVLNQGADALVEDREVLRLAQEDGIIRPALDVLAAMPVPLAVVERDHARPSLDEPPGH